MNSYPSNKKLTRRAFLALSGQVCAGAVITSSLPGFAGTAQSNHLSFYHLHTKETLKIDLNEQSHRTFRKLNRFLRDFRTGEIHPIDRQILVILSRIQKLGGSTGVYEVISGYRSASTNEMLRRKSSGIASKSLHIAGRAIDIRLTDMRTSKLRDLACSLKKGGVGYYPESDFVHIDTGRIRFW